MVGEVLESRLKALEELSGLHLQIARYMLRVDGGAIFGADLVASAVLHRSLGLIRGFCGAIRDENYLCAAPLVRIQLDNLLRFYAFFLVENPHETALRVFEGEPLRKQADKNGKKMTDRYLVEKLSQELPWVKSVYDATSGFIHFSERHMFCSQGDVDEASRSVSVHISGKDVGIPDSARLEAIEGMIEITGQVLRHVYGWAHTKDVTRLATGGSPDSPPVA